MTTGKKKSKNKREKDSRKAVPELENATSSLEEQTKSQIEEETGEGAAPVTDVKENESVEESKEEQSEAVVSQAALEEMKDRMLRALADNENVKRRAIEQVNTARTYAIEGFARDLLDVADNLDRALEAYHKDEDESERSGRDDEQDTSSAFFEGVMITRKALMSAFERHGVSGDNPLHAVFDPHRHQAVARLPSDVPAGHIAEVMQSGYYLGNRVLRAAMVVISTGPEEHKSEEKEGENMEKQE